MKQQMRDKMRDVLRRATAVDLSELIDTELFLGQGFRESPARAYMGTDFETISEWTEDIDPRYISWPLTAANGFKAKLTVKYKRLVNIEWWLLNDCSLTMDFATEGDIKRMVGAVLAVSFAQIGQSRRDRICHIAFNELQAAPAIEDAEDVDFIPVVLEYPSVREPANGLVTGLLKALVQLPEDRAIVPIISDFMQLCERDKKGDLTPAALLGRQQLKHASKAHKILCCIVEDPREQKFPNASGQLTIQDMRSRRRQTMTYAKAHKLVAAERQARLSELTTFLKKTARCDFAIFNTNDTTSEMRKKIFRLLHSGGSKPVAAEASTEA